LIDNVLRAIQGHKGILEAIEKGDLEKVNRAMKCHLEQSKKDILRYAFTRGNKNRGVIFGYSIPPLIHSKLRTMNDRNQI
jgi:hypothetical protein